jgi:hypothetical protein
MINSEWKLLWEFWYNGMMKAFPLFVVFASALGSLGTYVIGTGLGVGPVFGAAATGAIGSFFWSKDQELHNMIPAAIYCGAFAGMSSSFVIDEYGLIAISGVISGIMLLCFKNLLIGIGGKLGVAAFISVLCTVISVGFFV